MDWQTDAAGNTMCAHGTFGPLETCADCLALVTPDSGAPAEMPVNPAAHADELWCRAQRDALIALAVEMTVGRDEREAVDRVGYSTVAKIYEVALKFHRAAMDERVRRDDKEHARWLVEQARILKGLGKAH